MGHTGTKSLEEVNLKVTHNEPNKHGHLTPGSYPLTDDSRDNHEDEGLPSEVGKIQDYIHK